MWLLMVLVFYHLNRSVFKNPSWCYGMVVSVGSAASARKSKTRVVMARGRSECFSLTYEGSTGRVNPGPAGCPRSEESQVLPLLPQHHTWLPFPPTLLDPRWLLGVQPLLIHFPASRKLLVGKKWSWTLSLFVLRVFARRWHALYLPTSHWGKWP